VLAGASPSALSPLASAAKAGFQTTITVHTAAPYIEVQALAGSGAVVGSSAVVKA